LLASEPALSERAAALVLDGLAQPRSATERALGTFLGDAIVVAGLLGGTPAQPGTRATPVAVTATPEVIASADQVGAPGLESPLEFSPELSAREHAVLSLIAGGLANKQIAQQLAISERTVKVHVSSVLNKLGADNRARAAVLATQHGLL
jgi:DNA-binding CsgD family transcriptional regulator